MKTRYVAVAITLLIMLAALCLLNAGIGGVKTSLIDIIRPGTTQHDILWKMRLPRMAAAAILDGALALSGFLLQTFFNNPIAGPFVLGISSGAKLIVALVMVFVLSRGASISSAGMIAAAFAGAMMSMGFVLLIARRVRRAAVLIISGVMIGYICSAITDFVVTFASDESIVNLHHWSQGSFSGTSWDNVRVMAIVVFVASVFVFLMSKPIGAYQLGEKYAQSVGVNIKAFRILLVLLSSILCACVTAFAGPVAFVGVAVPHLVKAFAKTAKPELMTCGDVVAVGRYPYTGMLGILSETDKGKIDDAMRTVNALEIKDRSFSEVSDGQLQRIMLARAICQEPEIIVLDEPTSFLDIRYAVEIVDILRRMAAERGVTVVTISSTWDW